MVTRESVQKELACVERFFEFWSLKRAFVAVAIPIVFLWLMYSACETSWFEGMLPAQIETYGLASVSRDKSLPAILIEGAMGVRYKSCGGATFSLTRRTLAAIEADGLGFLDQAHKSRRDTGHRMPFAYGPWRATPLPSEWTDLGPWLGLNCMGWPWTRARIFEAAREPGSYYTTTYNAELLVIPRLGLAVLTFYGI
jgi:hypothetical protein